MESTRAPFLPPRILVRAAWLAHRAMYQDGPILEPRPDRPPTTA